MSTRLGGCGPVTSNRIDDRNRATEIGDDMPASTEPRARPLGPVLSGTEFWELMERWQVPDGLALDLIGFPGRPGASGKRPRFKFTTRQRRITSYLREIDAALSAVGKGPTWLRRRVKSAPFSQHTPLEHMVAHGTDGMADVLRQLSRMAMSAALAP